jgi:hypothetical protein
MCGIVRRLFAQGLAREFRQCLGKGPKLELKVFFDTSELFKHGLFLNSCVALFLFPILLPVSLSHKNTYTHSLTHARTHRLSQELSLLFILVT